MRHNGGLKARTLLKLVSGAYGVQFLVRLITKIIIKVMTQIRVTIKETQIKVILIQTKEMRMITHQLQVLGMLQKSIIKAIK